MFVATVGNPFSSSGNHTTGSLPYSDLVDDWADLQLSEIPFTVVPHALCAYFSRL